MSADGITIDCLQIHFDFKAIADKGFYLWAAPLKEIEETKSSLQTKRENAPDTTEILRIVPQRDARELRQK